MRSIWIYECDSRETIKKNANDAVSSAGGHAPMIRSEGKAAQFLKAVHDF
jgi:hypothetical protein